MNTPDRRKDITLTTSALAATTLREIDQQVYALRPDAGGNQTRGRRREMSAPFSLESARATFSRIAFSNRLPILCLARAPFFDDNPPAIESKKATQSSSALRMEVQTVPLPVRLLKNPNPGKNFHYGNHSKED